MRRFSMLGTGGARAGEGSADRTRECDGVAFVNEHRTFEHDRDGDSGGDGSGESESNVPRLMPAAAGVQRQWQWQW